VEKKFATHTARMRAMMKNAECDDEQRTYLVNEALNCAVVLDWLVVTEVNGINKTRAEHYGGKIPKFAKNLRIWGEAGVVKTVIALSFKLSLIFPSLPLLAFFGQLHA